MMTQLLLLAVISTVCCNSYNENNSDGGKKVVSQITGMTEAEKSSKPWLRNSGVYRYCGYDPTYKSCCLHDLIVDPSQYEGLENIVLPELMNVHQCGGDCPRDIPFFGKRSGNKEKSCQPVRWESFNVLIDMDKEGQQIVEVPDLIVRGCACV